MHYAGVRLHSNKNCSADDTTKNSRRETTSLLMCESRDKKALWLWLHGLGFILVLLDYIYRQSYVPSSCCRRAWMPRCSVLALSPSSLVGYAKSHRGAFFFTRARSCCAIMSNFSRCFPFSIVEPIANGAGCPHSSNSCSAAPLSAWCCKNILKYILKVFWVHVLPCVTALHRKNPLPRASGESNPPSS